MTNPSSDKAWQRDLLDVLIRSGLIVALVVLCYRIFHPFLDLMLWSVILAVTLYPLRTKLIGKLGNNEGWTATLIVVVAIGVLLLPIYLLGSSLSASAESAIAATKGGSVRIPMPAESVASLPIVGKQIYGAWMQAATDLSAFAQKFAPQIRDISVTLLKSVAGFGVGLLMFIAATILSGIFIAYGEGGSRSAVQIATRIAGPERGPQIATLCTATIRAVAVGVVGIAFIQMLLVGIGFVVKDVPGAGILALAVLLLGIAQIPATLVTVPVIIYVFVTEGASVTTFVFAAYVFVAGLVDNVLKPLLLGRGVDVPMPVVLIGALGGMVTSGTVGLFMGPVILGVGYQLFWTWVDEARQA